MPLLIAVPVAGTVQQDAKADPRNSGTFKAHDIWCRACMATLHSPSGKAMCCARCGDPGARLYELWPQLIHTAARMRMVEEMGSDHTFCSNPRTEFYIVSVVYVYACVIKIACA